MVFELNFTHTPNRLYMNHEAIHIIKAEHRSLAAVLNAAEYIRAEICANRMVPNVSLLWAIIRYIEEFPETLHHPKEDDFLFSRLKSRTHAADALITTLNQEHQEGKERIQTLRAALTRFERNIEGGSELFFCTLEAFIQFHFHHMTMEERDIFPLAELHLSQQDWQEIAAAFRDNQDPLFGEVKLEYFRELFHQIVQLTPAPIGLAS